MKIFLLILFSAVPAFGQVFEVLTYQHAPNPDGVPTNWPARVEPVTGRQQPWVVMTAGQLESHKANHLAAYTAWHRNFETTNTVATSRNFVEAKLLSEPEWVIVFKALGRILASELSQVRTNPIVPLPARTQNQFITALRQAVADIIAEDINTNTVVIPNP